MHRMTMTKVSDHPSKQLLPGVWHRPRTRGVSVEMEVCWMQFSAAAATAWGSELQRHSRGGHQEPRNIIGGKPIWQ